MLNSLKIVSFGLQIPKTLDGVNAKILNPREAWENKEEYDNALNYFNRSLKIWREIDDELRRLLLD